MADNTQGGIPQSNKTIPSVHTYQSDVSDSLKQKDISLIDIALSEHEKNQDQPKIEEQRSWYKPVSIILIVGALITLGVVFVFRNGSTPPLPIKTINSDVIKTDSQIIIPLSDSTNIIETINQKISTAPQADGIVRLHLIVATTSKAEVPVPIERIMRDMNIPPYLARDLGSKYIVGIHTLNGSSTPFIILKASFEIAVAGMREWESTLTKDFQRLFSIASSPVTAQVGPFKSGFIDNTDVYSAYNNKNQPVLIYSVPNKDTIVITSSNNAFREIITRLATSQLVQ